MTDELVSVVGILPALGSGLTDLARSGQHERLLDYDLRAYAQGFDRVLYFSYFHESLDDFTADPFLAERIRVIPTRGRWPAKLYAILMPLVHRRAMRSCAVLRVEQFSGVIPALLARWLWGIPFVVTYGYDYAAVARARGARVKPWLYRALAAVALPQAAGVIVTTEALARRVRGRVRVIPNGVDLVRFAPSLRPPSWPYLRVLYVGRLEPEKNVARLIEAVASLRRVAIELVIVGDGAERAALEALARSLGVRATFVGAAPYCHMPSWFAEADVFVLPSLTEGHPKALLEAMAAGVPCAGSMRGGIMPLIGPEARGKLFDPTKTESIACAIVTLLTDRALAQRLADEARVFVARFDLHRVLDEEVRFVQSVSLPSGPSRAAHGMGRLHPSPRSPMPAAISGDSDEKPAKAILNAWTGDCPGA